MCGICGAGFKGEPPISREDLRRMNELLSHRGPNGDGYMFEGGAWFAQKRLSVIDLPGGGQPIWNEDKTVALVFNGEIYNYLELRAELEGRGHRFASAGDGEVMVHLYEEMGRDFVLDLRGMFACAIWDKRSRELLLARDRMGIKPLYWAPVPGGLVFASELRSLLCLPGISRELDPDGVRRFLIHDATPAPKTAIRQIQKLPAGHLLVLGEHGPLIHRYHSILGSDEPPIAGRSSAMLTAELGSILTDSIKHHLLSDVPVGVFLSGGLDSSFIAAEAARLAGGSISTFSIAFDEPSFDESKYSRLVAAHLGTNHLETRMSSADALGLLSRLETFMDEPLGDPAVLATYILSQAAARSVVVALSGEGGDELFYGYPTYKAHLAARYYRMLPRVLREGIIKPAVESLPASDRNFSIDFIAKRFVRGAGRPAVERHVIWMSSVSPSDTALFSAEFARGFLDPTGLAAARDLVGQELPDADPLRIASFLDLSLYLQDGILMRTDKASMAHSLEVRVPILDNEVLRFARRLPSSVKLPGMRGGGKWILKELAKPLLPREIVERPKKGFGLPISGWLKRELKPLMLEMLSADRLRRQGIFEPAEIQRLIEEHLNGRNNHRKALWVLLIFQLWIDKVLRT